VVVSRPARPAEPPAADVEALRGAGWTADRAGTWTHPVLRGFIYWRAFPSETMAPGWTADVLLFDERQEGHGTLTEACVGAWLGWKP
jgi:hypothetical protein